MGYLGDAELHQSESIETVPKYYHLIIFPDIDEERWPAREAVL